MISPLNQRGLAERLELARPRDALPSIGIGEVSEVRWHGASLYGGDASRRATNDFTRC